MKSEPSDVQALLMGAPPIEPKAGVPDVKVARIKTPKPPEKAPLPHWCHEVVMDNVRGSENYHVCTVRTDESPYMHMGIMHACPCGFVWGHAEQETGTR